MTRKDFIMIAAVLAASKPGTLHPASGPEARRAHEYALHTWKEIVNGFVSKIGSTTPTFNAARFKEACGYE